MTWGVHISLAPTWFDPAETLGIITPFMVMHAIHDALAKSMPGNPERKRHERRVAGGDQAHPGGRWPNLGGGTVTQPPIFRRGLDPRQPGAVDTARRSQPC
jgi:hypothetical protein